MTTQSTSQPTNQPSHSSTLINAQNFVASVERWIEEQFDGDASNINSGIVTIHSEGAGRDQAFDVVRNEDGKGYTWGYDNVWRDVINGWLNNPNFYPVSIVVRVFTKERFPVVAPNGRNIKIPGKEIRMFACGKHGEDFQQLTKDECFACMNTDEATGKALPVDTTIKYIGPESNQ